MNRNRTLLLPFLLLTFLVPVGAGARSTIGRAEIDTVRYGMKLSLIVPKRALPQDALVRVTVRLKNVSRRAVLLTSSCPYYGIDVEVVNGSGQIVYPPILPGQRPPTTCLPDSVVFRPGQVLTRTPYLILRGERVQASAFLRLSKTSAASKTVKASMTVELLQSPSPTVSLHTSPPVFASVQQPPAATGSLKYMQWDQCSPAANSSSGGTVFETGSWQRASDSRVDPSCPDPVEWHAVAGWLNHPVASIDYVKH